MSSRSWNVHGSFMPAQWFIRRILNWRSFIHPSLTIAWYAPVRSAVHASRRALYMPVPAAPW